jgi:hypothetical protein
MIGVAKAGGIVAYADYGVLFHLVINTPVDGVKQVKCTVK